MKRLTERTLTELVTALALGVGCFTAGFLTADEAHSWRRAATERRWEAYAQSKENERRPFKRAHLDEGHASIADNTITITTPTIATSTSLTSTSVGTATWLLDTRPRRAPDVQVP